LFVVVIYGAVQMNTGLEVVFATLLI